MKKKAFILGLFSVLAVAIFARWIFFDNEAVWLDEVYSLKYAGSENIISDIIENNDPHPPGYYLLLNLWQNGGEFLGINSEISAKIFSVLFGILGILMIYFWAFRKWKIEGLNGFGAKMSYFLGIGFALNFFAIFYSLEIRMYSLLFFLMSLSLYILFSLMENFSWKKFCGVILVLTLSLYVHYFAFFWVAFLFIFWIFCGVKFWKWIIAGASVAILYLPWASVLIKQVLLKTAGGSENLTSWLTLPSPSYKIFKIIFEEFFYFQGFMEKRSEDLFALLIFIFAALIAYLFVRKFFRNNKKWILFFGLGFLFNLILPYIFSVTFSPIIHPRYLVGAFLLTMIFAAFLASKLKVGYYFGIIFMIIFSGAVLFQANGKYFHPDWNGFFIKYGNDLPQIIYVSPDYYKLSLEYHLAKRGIVEKEILSFETNEIDNAEFLQRFAGQEFVFIERLSQPEFVKLMKEKCVTDAEDHLERIGYYVFICQ